MSGSFLNDGFAGRGRGGASGWPISGLWEAMEQFRSQFEQKSSSSRVGRGDVRAAVLALLAEKPMHGYQIIREIDERSGGAWKPSPGSVYPTLQLLTDEGLVSASESDGRKTYALTEAGRAVADVDGDRSAPWESAGSRDGARDGGRAGALPKSAIDLAQAVGQVGRSGSPEQVRQAIDVLDDARRRIFTILAQD